MHRRAIASALALAVVAACGGWDDRPLEPGDGEVAGRFSSPVDPARAWAMAAGHPSSMSTVDASGRFVLHRVPSGPNEILASDGRGGSFDGAVTVYADREVQLSIHVAAGAAVSGIATLEGLSRPLPVSIALGELPLKATTDTSGRFTLTGLPAGCRSLSGSRDGWITAEREACVFAGQTITLTLHLRRDPASAAHLALCEGCTTDADCFDGTCAALDDGTRACTRGCEYDSDCPTGTACRAQGSAHVCLPTTVGCATFVDTSSGKGCVHDADCGGSDDSGAKCVAGSCTQACDDASACPLGLVCQVGQDGESVCR